MQVILIKESNQHNPDFDRKQPVSEENHPIRRLPVGTIVTGPEAYKLCLVEEELAEPYDDEAKAKIAKLFTDGFRPNKVTIQLPEDPIAVTGDAAVGIRPRPPRAPDAPAASSPSTIPAEPSPSVVKV